MAIIEPFICIRPSEGKAAKIAALPYDVYNRKEAKEETLRHPLSFLTIDRAETQLSDQIDPYDEIVYQKAHDLLWERVQTGDFIRDELSTYYIYELTMAQRTQTGIVACASIDDYINHVIKKHENTRASKEKDRICHVDTCNAQTGPIFLAYRKNEELKEIVENAKKQTALYDFISDDAIRHRVFKIIEPVTIKRIRDIFESIDQLYIADGHHRAASAVKVGLKRRKEHPGYSGTEPFNYFLSVLFPDEELFIMDYNRVVKDLNHLSEHDFLQKVQSVFDLSKLPSQQNPSKKGEISMCLNHQWYLLTVREADKQNDPVKGLDVSLLQDLLLEPILGIHDPKTDERIDFIGGIRGWKELEKRANSDCVVAFAMFPTSIQELFQVADAGQLMPPKSTWFEPKLRSGLFIHEI
ncbi:MAG: DUF1015 domain-containing protein [Lachnospiraceae bacterium]